MGLNQGSECRPAGLSRSGCVCPGPAFVGVLLGMRNETLSQKSNIYMQSLTLKFLKIFSSVSKHFKVIVENPTNSEKAAGGLSMSRDPQSPLWSSYPGTHGWGCRRPPPSPSHSEISGHCSVHEQHLSCTARALPGHLGQRHKSCRQPPPQRRTDNWLCPCHSVASAGGRRPLSRRFITQTELVGTAGP